MRHVLVKSSLGRVLIVTVTPRSHPRCALGSAGCRGITNHPQEMSQSVTWLDAFSRRISAGNKSTSRSTSIQIP